MLSIVRVLLTAWLLLTATSSWTKGAGLEWDLLNQEVQALRKKGEYGHAIVVAKKALAVAEKASGPDHTDVSASLNNLAAAFWRPFGVREQLFLIYCALYI